MAGLLLVRPDVALAIEHPALNDVAGYLTDVGDAI
jgi:hypothetical protein